MKRLFISIVFCLYIVFPASAQNINVINDLGIEAEELDMVQDRIKEIVKDFQRWLQDLAGRGNLSHKEKMAVYDRAIKLFIGEGKPYKIPVPSPYGGFEEKTFPAVKMGTINSKFSGERHQTPMKDYLMGLINKSEDPNYKYKQIVIEAAAAVRVDNFSKVGEGRYTATAHILQHFVGYRDNELRFFYEDYTAKRIKIFINRIELVTPEGIEHYWEIQLGDVDCDDIW